MENLTSDTHKKMLIALIACASLGAVLVVSLFLWIYYRRNSPTSINETFRAQVKPILDSFELSAIFIRFESIHWAVFVSCLNLDLKMPRRVLLG